MKVELLYFDGCPSWETGLKNLESALQEEGITASIHMIKVNDEEEASQQKFLGSPSFRVDGRDLWHEEREAYSLSCRVYPTPTGIKGFPTVDMLRTKIHSLTG